MLPQGMLFSLALQNRGRKTKIQATYFLVNTQALKIRYGVRGNEFEIKCTVYMKSREKRAQRESFSTVSQRQESFTTSNIPIITYH